MYIIFGIVAVVVLWVIFAYNRFISLINRAKESWSDIEVQLKRRYDLIPNLVNTVKGYAAHEREAFESVTRARAEALGAKDVHDKAVAENHIASALKSIFAIAEAYPDLKANQNFAELQRELSDTENKIQAARRFYNSTVMDLNTAVDQFPNNLIAGAFRFGRKEFFELEAGEQAAKKPVEVKF